MVVALLLSLSGTVFSGLVVYALEENAGPLSGWLADDAGSEPLSALPESSHANTHESPAEPQENAFEEFWEEAHEILANFTLLLVGLHIAGVLFSSFAHHENLIKGMVTGRKRSD